MTPPSIDLYSLHGLDEVVAEMVRRIAVAGFWSLWRGETARIEEIVQGDAAVLEEAVDHLRARGRIELLEDGELVGVHGLTRRPTSHRIEHGAGAVQTWCALDAIGIPAALAIDARAVTGCPTCQRPLEVALAGGKPEPANALLWYPETTGCWSHLVDDFCSGANLFCSLVDLRVAVRQSTGTVMAVPEVAALGRETWSDVASVLQDGRLQWRT